MPTHGVDAWVSVDYAAVLKDLEAKRTAIENAIAGIKAMIQAGGNASIAAPTESSIPAPTRNGHIPPNAFFGKTIPEAAKLYLQMVKCKQTTAEIADALQRGGMETTSSKFDQTVAAGLNRSRKATGEIVKLRGGRWGLSEWFGRAVKRPREVKTEPAAKPSPSKGESLPTRIISALHQNPGPRTPAELRAILGQEVPRKDLASSLYKLVKAKRIDKIGPAQYQSKSYE